ncbi:intermembrane lipid transfer protein Vps13D [Pectinophora gossypiella]|nr:intermembrane lipid transfer protein Vps13D [Pectinophora gossypiella]
MLEGLVAWVLNNYLGKYVENLNTDQLSVALLSGKVELENLPLKKDALRHLGLPVEVKAGFIGKVQLQVPVRQIRSAPWLIAIEKLYVVAAPVNLDEWDAEVEASIAHERKVSLLEALEAEWRVQHEAADAGYYATSYSSWLSYGTGLLANIVENLQLKLNDVHIRFEDAITCSPQAFACGLTAEALSAESCDAEWRRGFTLLPDPDGCSFKLLELQKLAVYWDPMPGPAAMFANCTINELTERMAQTWKATHRYLLEPASATARVRRERTAQPLRSRTRPRLTAHLTLHTVALNLNSRQYSEAVGCALGLEQVAKLREFRALRPAAPVKGHAREWWIYALKCHTHHYHFTEPRPTWASCAAAGREARAYVDTCLFVLANPAATLPAAAKRAKDEYEWRMPLHILKALREVAMRKVPAATPVAMSEQPAPSGRSMLVHWFPQWWGWYGQPPHQPHQPPAPAPEPPPAPDLEEEILDVIADSLENNTLLKRDTVFGKFEFVLSKGCLNLSTEVDEAEHINGGTEHGGSECPGTDAGVELQFSSVCVRLESRPRASSLLLAVSLGAVCLRERITPNTLFPVLIAPQGMIREGLSAMNPSAAAMSWCRAQAAPAPAPPDDHEPLFQLTYEKKPFGLNCDYKLWVKSQSLEVVWCAAAARWALGFARGAWGAAWARPRLAMSSVRDHTRQRLITHIEHMMHPHPGERRSWQVELDISAPQILFVEELCDREASVLVVDFGRLRLCNVPADGGGDDAAAAGAAVISTEEDEELFMTPCSTPPASLLSPADPPLYPAAHAPLDAANLHTRLYDRYKIELSDLQILVGRARDNWKYAHTKTTSSLHLLDRFSISLQAERRVVHTSDPQYPTATLCGSLPALVVHLSEQKLLAVRAVIASSALIADPAWKEQQPGTERTNVAEEDASCSSDTPRSEHSAHHHATLLMLQFHIDQMSLEVQSRGRSIAEVQVCGVKAALTARPLDVSLSLSVHSLLLVDALQTYGPDFELLVASHKHVGMDTASGSIRDSEPTSPTSPTSPASPVPAAHAHAHPHALHQALYSLHHGDTHKAGMPDPERLSPGPSWTTGNTWNTSSTMPGAIWGNMGSAWGTTWGPAGSNWGPSGPTGSSWNYPGAGAGGAGWGAAGLVDSEALIAVELCLVKGEGDSEDLRIANILFNNLDIIANQETIVELIGFTQRVLGTKSAPKKVPSDIALEARATFAQQAPAAEEEFKKETRTEITFDFHRLGVLLLRAAVLDGTVVAKKIATATLGEAKIQATIGGGVVSAAGSLGGVQVVSLCEGAGVHSRVLAAGHQQHQPHQPHDHDHHDGDKALLFTIHRTVHAAQDGNAPVVEAKVSMHVASVWYTHSGPLLRELQSCLTEFKQYLANLARSIRAAAADMAIGLVHPRGESLYANPKLSQSMEGVSPRRRTTSMGCSLDDPPDLTADNIVLSVSVELESPVVVVPRAAMSTQVFVAHLGRMSLNNRPGPPTHTSYRVRVRDISLASLDVGEKLRSAGGGGAGALESMEDIYDVSRGKPVLHNTALQLAAAYRPGDHDDSTVCEVTGKIVGGLHVSARREQYEQLLETLRWISSTADAADAAAAPPAADQATLVEPAVPTLRLDPQLRAAVLAVPPPQPQRDTHAHARSFTPLTVVFELPMFTLELRADLGHGERSLVQLAFREFTLRHQRTHAHETMLQVSLHSVTMEDLTKDPESKHRLLMMSHTPQVPPKAVYVSKSCPDFVTEFPSAATADDMASISSLQYTKHNSCSLPSQLNVADRQQQLRRNKRDSKCGLTPPCSPEPSSATPHAADGDLAADDNLVWVNVHTRDPDHPLFEEKYNKVSKLTKVDFNCLNLVVNIDSWVAVLDFFGVAGDDLPDGAQGDGPQPQQTATQVPAVESGTTEMETTIRSLAVVVVTARGEACRALVSRVWLRSRLHAAGAGAGAGAGPARTLHARLGALALTDLTPHAPLWRDRLRTTTDHALQFTYRRLAPADAAVAGHDTSLHIDMGPVTYVHTKRFVQELQAFARDFSLLRRVILQARLKVSSVGGAAAGGGRAARTSLRVRCRAPVIVLPVSGRARAALLAELTHLHVDNCFKQAGDPGTASTMTDPNASVRETLDVRVVQLAGLSLWCARGGRGGRGLRVRRAGPPLLPAPQGLALTVEHNMSATHNVPDMTIQGTLTTLQCALDPSQYRLVRGVLAHNLGECVDDLLPPPAAHQPLPHHRQVWTTSSLKLDLQDVTMKLEPVHGVSSLACINFIKSRLLVETYSDLSQDIDLVSQEILVSDTRYSGEPANRRGNVFSHIVQPMPDHPHSVQAELHARKRRESSAYTILVNNMRLMAVLDWWEAAHQFLMQPPPPPADADQPPLEEPFGACRPTAVADDPGQMELKLNVTDSQLVLVEDASVWDTNAVILKSTTVITYRAADSLKPVSCSLNELEVFSCVLGLEEETALSIVDPAALHVALHADHVLHVDMGTLNLRLSYHDMRMFAAMLQSLPVQARVALSGGPASEAAAGAPANSSHMRPRLYPPHAPHAPRWARAPLLPPQPKPKPNPIFPLRAVQVNAECITLCVIDDCLDSDVPLLEVSLSELQVEQDLRKVEEAFEDPLLVSTPCGAAGAVGAVSTATKRAGAGGGRLAGALSADYYNRTLSGWEPVVEPWKFETSWEYTLTSGLSLGRMQVEVTSQEVLNTNVTSSLIELCQLVRANWTADYYAPQASNSQEQSPKGSPAGHRRRSPFVPYALRNHTGHRLWFTTLLTTSDVLHEGSAGAWCGPDDSWVAVRAGDTEPFSFGSRRARARHAPADAHPSAHAPAPLHRLALRLDGWAPPDPVCVDRVGVYFRHLTHTKTGAEARIVFEVSLEGSARKLVTVRSALQLINKLPHPVEVRVDHAPNTAQWSSSGSRAAAVGAGGAWAAPLGASSGALWVRPLLRHALPAAPAALDWRLAPALLHAECRAPPDTSYRFCCVVIREQFPPERSSVPIAGHTLTLVPALRLENLLPLELTYRAAAPDDAAAPRALGALPPGDTQPFHEVNVEEGVELSVKLEGFGWSSPLSVGGAGAANSFSARLKLRDTRGRRLYLNARVTIKKTDGIKVSISAAYWLVNRTGLPLVFRAEGGAGEAAGQFDEHEVARMVAPLLFSFAEADGGPTVAARLGRGVAANPEWCSPFGLGPGVAVKRLEARGLERVYLAGVCARAGRGRYRHTNIVTLAPRYQLHNNTTHHLQFAQKCTATTLNDPGAMATHVSAVSGCYLPWHWARHEREQLLCVRLLGPAPAHAQPAPPAHAQPTPPAPRTAWSGGFRIDSPRTLHIACREVGGSTYQFVRVEVVLQGCTLFVVLSDGDCAPAPLRIDNYSAVAIMFHQVGCAEECVVGAHAASRWALPEPEGAPALALRAPGGPRTTLPLDKLPAHHHLLYQNFIYIVFTHTTTRDFVTSATAKSASNSATEDDGALVLEVPLNSTRVVLGRKRYGDRSQLWRRGPNDQLIHEGSSPPQPTDALLSDDTALSPHSMVLDIEDAAPRPGRAAALQLRRADGRRASTQAWRLLPPGRMACAHANLCVQPDGGLMALTPGSRVVLGLPESRGGGAGRAVPAEQAVSWQTLRPGSGRLDVALTADGPTRVVRIHDHKEPESGWIEGEEEEEKDGSNWGGWGEWGVRVSLAGVGVSLVARAPAAELVHARLAGLSLELQAAPASARLALIVHHMQWDNQLLGTASPVLLYCLPERGGAALPALHAAAELMRTRNNRYNAHLFRHLIIALRPLAIRLEERLILKLWSWAAPPAEDPAREAPDEAEYEARRVLDELTALHATRLYFALIKIIPSQIRLSMCTANKLEPGLASLKRRLGLTLIRFEDACVELEPFVRAHPFETPACLARQLLKHFKDELKWQAAKILGSVDFLGNPLGFVADVSEGVSGFFLEGNVSALLKNVTHGISNSAAKVTESLGDGLERVVGDEAHEETRRRIRSAAAGAHLAAGIRGFGLGILGGMTSLVKHSYEGATQEGLPGFLAGVGKGLVGTVTKPVIGVLDLAAETASALRDTSRRSDKWVPARVRAPRCGAGAGGLLPRYCAAQAAGAALLHALNGADYAELFLAYRTVRGTPHDIRALLSTTYLRIFTCKHHQPQIVMETHLSNLVSCVAVSSEGAHYVELGVRGGGGGGGAGGAEAVRRPRVQCDSAELAGWVAKHAAYARQLYHEQVHTLLPHTDL